MNKSITSDKKKTNAVFVVIPKCINLIDFFIIVALSLFFRHFECLFARLHLVMVDLPVFVVDLFLFAVIFTQFCIFLWSF